MITLGFVPSQSDAVTLDQPFTQNGLTYLSAYIFPAGAGDIVWENNQGEPQWFPNAAAGQGYILGAKRILTNATVNGTPRTTTATNMTWVSINQVYNTP